MISILLLEKLTLLRLARLTFNINTRSNVLLLTLLREKYILTILYIEMIFFLDYSKNKLGGV